MPVTISFTVRSGYVGGGYDDDLDVLADRHINLHWAASKMWLDHGL